MDKKIGQYIADRPCMVNAGTNVIINVSSRSLNLINVDTGEIIAAHQMPRISFASGGDTVGILRYGSNKPLEDIRNASIEIQTLNEVHIFHYMEFIFSTWNSEFVD